MAKNRNKKKIRSDQMAVDIASADHLIRDEFQATDTSETAASIVCASVSGSLRKMKKGRPMKRSKNMRKIKALAKAICQSEKSLEKITKSESKALRTKFAKNLYD